MTPRALNPDDLRRRASRVALVLTDCDGVLTDTGVYYSAEGELLKRFSIRDGMGVELLRKAGIPTVIVTGERSGAVARRAEKLGITVYPGAREKLALLPRILEETGRRLEELAYIGDDVNDLAIIEAIRPHGLTASPADAMDVVRSAVHLVCEQEGGRGAFRGFADRILSLREGGGRR